MPGTRALAKTESWLQALFCFSILYYLPGADDIHDDAGQK